MTHISKNDRPTRRMTLEALKVPLSQDPKHWLGSNSIFHQVAFTFLSACDKEEDEEDPVVVN